jgi:ElaA protein
MGVLVHAAPFAELPPRRFHDIVRLRESVFVVEQDCPYHELDGRDVLSDTLHLWIEEGDEVVCYLRLYPGSDADWIGRVVTAADHRGRGLAAHLLRDALRRAGRPVRLSAQTRLAGWYERFGFLSCGPDFEEDGIMHTPMRLA